MLPPSGDQTACPARGSTTSPASVLLLTASVTEYSAGVIRLISRHSDGSALPGWMVRIVAVVRIADVRNRLRQYARTGRAATAEVPLPIGAAEGRQAGQSVEA